LNPTSQVTREVPPQYYYRLGVAYATIWKNDEAIDACSKAAEAGFGSLIEQLAKQRIGGLKKRNPSKVVLVKRVHRS